MKTRTADSVEADFDRAVELHRQGKLADAMERYQAILARAPEHSGAVHLLGVALSQQGQYDLAAQFIGSAIVLNGSVPLYHVNHGNALMGAGRTELASDAYGRALVLKGDLPEAWFGLGNARMALGRTAEAADAFEKAVAAQPDFAEALANLGGAYMALDRPNDAIGVLDRAAGLRPNDAPPRFVLAQALDRVGRRDEAAALYLSLADLPRTPLSLLFQAANWLATAKLFEPAVTVYKAALGLEPGEMVLWNNLGNALRELGRLNEARNAYGRALALFPDDPALLSNLGSLHKDLGDLDEAVRLGHQAVSLGGDVLAHSNLGYAYYLLGDIDNAALYFDKAAAIAPGDADAIFHQGIVDLLKGDWRQGWRRYEARWARRRASEPARHQSRPQWDGSDLSGKTILLWSEQGLGDTLQFIRFARQAADRGGRVLVECQPGLVSLVARMACVAGAFAVGDPLPQFDLQCPLMSLPHALGLDLETMTSVVPYLQADPELVARWQTWMAEHGVDRPRIGLVWAGESRKHDVECLLIDRRRSLSLADLAPVLDLAGARFVSLQLGPARAQLADFGAVVDPMGSVTDFSDTAALIETLDAVVSVDTSVAHLAAALAKPVYLLSRFDGCWRWLRNRADSPWYPTLKLYAQSQPGAWAPAVESVKEDVARQLEAS